MTPTDIEKLKEQAREIVERYKDLPMSMSEHEQLNRLRADIAAALEAKDAEIERLTAKAKAVSAAIGSVRFMDPPDGGNVTLAEQVRRMREELEAAEAALKEAREGLAALIDEEASACSLGRVRLGIVLAARLVRRGRRLTSAERLANLQAFVNEDSDAAIEDQP